jgi:polysaccharide deacetylase family protein (PEP-CTERM system associated)
VSGRLAQQPLPLLPSSEFVKLGAKEPCTHILSVDVEDYFMVEAFAGQVSRDSWSAWPSRVVSNTKRLLDLFDQHQVKATFFFVGWIADRFPALAREVLGRGHEIGCHGYWHRTIYSQTPSEFREDTRAAMRAIEDACGTKVYGYRAPTWSITSSCLWALDILAEEGFHYDSSIYAIHHDLYGFYGAPRFPYWHTCENGRVLGEFPPPTVNLLGAILPGAGGGYLRIFPLTYTCWVFRQFEKVHRQPVVVYCHPWEVDPDQPRIHAGLRSRFRHYTNLSDMKRRLQFLLSRYSFQPFRDLLDMPSTLEAQPPMEIESVNQRSGRTN